MQKQVKIAYFNVIWDMTIIIISKSSSIYFSFQKKQRLYLTAGLEIASKEAMAMEINPMLHTHTHLFKRQLKYY